MAALPPKDAALITAPKKGANLHDPYCLKRVLDDATSEVWFSFLSLGFLGFSSSMFWLGNGDCNVGLRLHVSLSEILDGFWSFLYALRGLVFYFLELIVASSARVGVS